MTLEAEYLEALAAKQEAEERIEKCKAAMLGMMECDKLTNVSTDLTTAIYTAPSTGRKFNSTNFKKDYPDLYMKYATEYQKGAYVQVKLKEQ